MRFLKENRRLFLWVSGEVAGILLLVAFVVTLANMPPLQVTRTTTDSLIPYEFKLDTKSWKWNVTRYVKTVSSGDLGQTRKGEPVGPVVLQRLLSSLKLLGFAAAIAVVLGVLKGFWDFQGIRKRKLALGPVLTGAVAGVPDFWLVLLLQLLASWMWRKLDMNPFRTSYDSTDPVSSLVYPLITLSLIPMAHVARVTATAMSNVYDRDYIRTARAKGLHEFFVVYKHALRNAVVQILDGMPGVMAVMVSNLLIVEYLFNYPGLTTLLKEAVAPSPAPGRSVAAATSPDVPVLVLAGVALGLIFSLLYLAVQVLRRLADPRLKERGTA